MLCLVWWNWILIGIVALFIISCPIIFNLFGKEDVVGCETLTWWQRFLRKKKQEKEEKK